MSEAIEGPGATLQAAREAMEISCREVAEALNLPVRTVEAIEANDYEKLPGAVFTRGYIRAYAKLLELDSDPIVARYPAVDNQSETTEVAPGRPLQDHIRDHPRWVLGGAVTVGVVAVIWLAVWLWPAADEPAELAATDLAQAESPPPLDSQPQVQPSEPARSAGDTNTERRAAVKPAIEPSV